ncbi:DNA replication ATP-dependent helicase/nuclease DNA2 [Vitis vinifera]|uniref:DNA replication ATP-dependent helicase/nuclease DNA2 n=1 Tax=Vitis vinifera TaxID=29760 RepID=A0A438CHK9_VITVI|nr:DNA replication ATP-dependent helicase/nuclease DNA2 [Vitis vinifera]
MFVVVAASFSCSRRTVLDERLKCSEHSTAALIGTLLHQIFQAGLIREIPTKVFLEEYARIVVQKNLESLYACGVNEDDMYKTLIEATPRILNWIVLFKNSQEYRGATVDFGSDDGLKRVNVSEVIDIEEMAWAPKYGLKGMIDASLRIKFESNTKEVNEIIMPLEFKTGKGTKGQASLSSLLKFCVRGISKWDLDYESFSAMEHTAQVILYTLLMSERYLKPIDSGLLYYLNTDHTQGIAVKRSDLVGLIMRRNELAKDILKASMMQQLPPMLQSPSMCKSCRHLNACTIYHKELANHTHNIGYIRLRFSLVTSVDINIDARDDSSLDWL